MVKYLELGQIVNTFGIHGEVKVKPFTEDNKRFDKLKDIYIELKDKLELFEIETVKHHKDMVIIKFKGIDSIEEAEKYRNKYLKIDREDAGKLPKDTYYIADLLNLNVYTDEGKLLGKVDDIFSAGTKDVYSVKDETGKQILLPGIPEVIKEIDLDEEKIIVHLIKGLVD